MVVEQMDANMVSILQMLVEVLPYLLVDVKIHKKMVIWLNVVQELMLL